MSTIIQNQTLILLEDQNFQRQIKHDLEHEYFLENKRLSKPLFSYYISADQNKTISQYYEEYAYQKLLDRKNFIERKILKPTSENKKVLQIDYNDRVIRDTNEEINYKKSFIKMSFEKIDNCMPIFTTITLPSAYHINNTNELLSNLFGEELQDKTEYLHYKGYKKVTGFSRKLYKNKLFNKGKLDKDNRSSITALEPHKDWTPHQHQLQFINSQYFLEYINIFVHTALKEQLGRTQIQITQDKFDLLKDAYNFTKRLDKKGNIEYWIINTNVYFQIFEIKNNDTVKSISNYLTSYIETKHILEENFKDTEEQKSRKKKNKKVVLNYDGWAYYISHLKDKYQFSEYGKTHQKIRRINYTQLLISRAVYKRIMNINFVEHLQKLGLFKNQDMYYETTLMLQRNELKIYKYIEVFDRSQGYPKYEKHNVNYYQIIHKGFDYLVDCKSYDIWEEKYGKLERVHQSKQIDLDVDDYVMIEYKLNIDGTAICYDLEEELF